MGITCCVCHKKQSGFFEDYPLFPNMKNAENLRVCTVCQEHIQTVERSGANDDVSDSLEHLKNCLSQGAGTEVTYRLQTVLNRYNERTKSGSVQPAATVTASANNHSVNNENKVPTVCESCGKTSKLYRIPVDFQNGGNGTVHFCEECYWKCKSFDGWFGTQTKGFVKEDKSKLIDPADGTDYGACSEPTFLYEQNSTSRSSSPQFSGRWTGVAKALIVLSVILSTIIGAVFGGMLDDEIGWLIGSFVGIVFSGIVAVFAMVIIEISENAQLTAYNTSRQLEVLEKILEKSKK